jgi:hypothetical protein
MWQKICGRDAGKTALRDAVSGREVRQVVKLRLVAADVICGGPESFSVLLTDRRIKDYLAIQRMR